MKLKYIILCLCLAPLTNINSQSSLEIEIINLKSNKGDVAIEFLDQNKKALKQIEVKIVDKKSTLVINDIKDGKYAIQFFHDENSNNELDKNLIGIPKEGFGFSNDGLGKFGPKDFEEWLFTISGDTKVILTTKYF